MPDPGGFSTQFMAPFLLRGPHVQSVLSSSALRRPGIERAAAAMRAQTEDLIISCSDNVQLLGHYTTAPVSEPTGLIVLIHGWEGSAESLYLLSAARHFWDAGFAVLRLNLRDHGESHHLNEDLFHSCRLQEVVDAVLWAQQRFAPKRFLLGGFSLGGNFAMRVAIKAPAAGIHLEQVLAVCPVLDPEQTMHALDQGSAVYRRYFIYKWRRSLLKKMAAFPARYDFSKLAGFSTLTAMTDYFVTHYTEYPDLHSYLKGYSLEGSLLEKLQVPAHMLLADDDPVIPVEGLQKIAKPASLQIDRTSRGGHCGFLKNWRLESWVNDWLLATAGQ